MEFFAADRQYCCTKCSGAYILRAYTALTLEAFWAQVAIAMLLMRMDRAALRLKGLLGE